MSAAKVTHTAAEFGLWQVILKKLEYSLVATTFTLKECNTIMSPILSARLPLAGLTRTFPWAIVYGPWQWGGLNIPNLFTGQMTKHVHMVMEFGCQLSNISSSLLQASCKALWLESELSGSVLDFLDSVYTYVSPTWLTHTWESCHNACIQVLGDNTDQKPQKQKDVELMRLFIWMGYRNIELNMLNRCQLYLRVVYHLEICTSWGTHLKQYLWNQPTIAKSPYQWPVIPKPTATEWRVWQQALQQAISLGRNLALPLPLGSWHSIMESRAGWYCHAAKTP